MNFNSFSPSAKGHTACRKRKVKDLTSVPNGRKGNKMKVSILTKTINNRIIDVIGVFSTESKAWKYVDIQAEIFGEQEYNNYMVITTTLN